MFRNIIKETVAVLALGLALAILWTWPLFPHLGQALPHDARFTPPGGSDMHIWVWEFWWVAEAAAGRGDFFFSDEIFLPNGQSLALHTHVFLWGFLTLPLQWLGGPIFAVGAAFLLLFATSFAAMWALLRTVGASRVACAFGAFAWAFSPYFLQKSLEHMDFGASPWPPLFLLFLLKWIHAKEGKTWTPALATGTVLGLTLLTSPLGTFSTLVLGALVLAFAPRLITVGHRGQMQGGLEMPLMTPNRARLLKSPALLPAALLALAIGWPWLSEAMAELRRAAEFASMHPELGDSLQRSTLVYAHLVDFLRLPGLNPIAQSLFGSGMPPDKPLGWNEVSGLHLSFALVPLALFALWNRWELRGWAWLSAALFLIVWDPGFGRGDGWISSLFRMLPAMDTYRIPTRFFPYFLLPVVVLAAFGLDRVWKHSRGVVAVVAVILAVENWVGTYPLMPVNIPSSIVQLSGEEGVEGVLTLPVQFGASQAMTWQTVHGKPVVFSYLARVSPKELFLCKEIAPDLFALAVPTVDRDGVVNTPDPVAVAMDLSHIGVDNILVDGSGTELPGQIRDVLSELLDEMPNWVRVECEGSMLWWQEMP